MDFIGLVAAAGAGAAQVFTLWTSEKYPVLTWYPSASHDFTVWKFGSGFRKFRSRGRGEEFGSDKLYSHKPVQQRRCWFPFTGFYRRFVSYRHWFVCKFPHLLLRLMPSSGIGMFACTYLYMYVWTYTGEVNAKRIRENYLQAVLRQDIQFFDKVGAGEVS